jgi:hypothetical protein
LTGDITNKLQIVVDRAFEAMKDWDAVIPFDNVKIPYASSYGRVDNILEYAKNKMWKGCKIYFDKCKYDTDAEKDGPGWKKLKKDLQKAARANGTTLIANGGNKKQRILVCNCHRTYRESRKKKKDPPETTTTTATIAKPKKVIASRKRKKTFKPLPPAGTTKNGYRKRNNKNDRRNGRGPTGKSMKRKTNTCKPLQNDATCKMHFSIWWDDDGYFIPGGTGNPTHTNHIRLAAREMVFPKRLLEEDEKSIIESIGQSNAISTVARNVHYNRTGNMLLQSQVAYINSLCKQAVSMFPDLPETSAVDRMFQHFRETGVSYCCLYHHIPQVTEVDGG